MGVPFSISDNERLISIDRYTNVLEIIDTAHQRIHEGVTYRSHYTLQLITETNVVWQAPPASGKQMHLLLTVIAQNEAHAIFYEFDYLPQPSGQRIVARNANRNYPNNSAVRSGFSIVGELDVGSNIFPIVDTPGTVILGETFLGSNFFKADGVGGALSSRAECVLRSDTFYGIQVEEESGAPQWITILMDWYEHSPKTS